ncbi:hypothetical protein TWF191_007124 [Orbilia oligospora]|uniref:Uncharacterized protein n=1 Tax=Orbilia oligospora TaxID=2813651 RepID=A0A7C8QQW8_ORBOL|nr:hypothetical protein TWF191_007124 [Orbilia oligospora]
MANFSSRTVEFQDLILQAFKLKPKDLSSTRNSGCRDIDELSSRSRKQMEDIRAIILRGDKLSEEATGPLDLQGHPIYTQVALYRLAAAKIFHLAEVLTETIEKGIKVVTPHGPDIVIVPAQRQGCERGTEVKFVKQDNNPERGAKYRHRQLESTKNQNRALVRRIKTLQIERDEQAILISSLRATTTVMIWGLCLLIAVIVLIYIRLYFGRYVHGVGPVSTR